MFKRMTIVSAVFAALIGVASTGRADEKKPPPKLYDVKVGDVFEVQGNVLSAKSPTIVQEFAKLARANDTNGQKTMLKQGA